MGDMYKIKRNIRDQLSPGGEGGAILANYNAYTGALKEERERLKKGEITEDQLRAWDTYTMNNYTGVGTKDPLTGNFNIMSPDGIAKYADPNKIMYDALSKLKAEEGGDEIVYDKGNWIIKKGTKFEVLSPDRIKDATATALIGSPEYMNYAKQLARFRGQDPGQSVMQDVTTRSNLFGSIYSYENQWNTMDKTANPYSLAAYKHSLQKELMYEPYDPLTFAGNATSTVFSDQENLIANSNTSLFEAMASNIPSQGGSAFLVPSPIKGGQPTKPRPVALDYDKTVSKAREQVPKIMQTRFNELAIQVKNEKGLSDKQRVDKLNSLWNKETQNLRTSNPTNIDLSYGPLGKQVRDAWPAWSSNGTWVEIGPDGKETVLTKPPRGFDPKVHLPSSMATTGRIGVNVKVGEKSFRLSNTAFHDRAIKALDPVMQLDAPLTRGEEGVTQVMRTSNGETFRLKSRIGRDAQGTFRQYIKETAEGEIPLTREETADTHRWLIRSGGTAMFGESIPSPKFQQYNYED